MSPEEKVANLLLVSASFVSISFSPPRALVSGKKKKRALIYMPMSAQRGEVELGCMVGSLESFSILLCSAPQIEMGEKKHKKAEKPPFFLL